MEKKVLLKELVETGTNLRKQITSKVRVSDQGVYPIGEIWDANTTINTIVDGATIAFDTLKEVEEKLLELDSELTAEISRAKSAETAETNRAKAAEQAETNRATLAENNLNNIKANKADVYTKQEVYNKNEVDNLLGHLQIVDQYAIYSYTSYNADGSVEYSAGKAQLTGEVLGDYTQIKVIEDAHQEYVGRTFYIPTDAQADGQTLNQLYDSDENPVGIAVKILLDSETTYKDASVKEYVDFIIKQHGGGQLGPNTVSSLDIIDGAIQMVDLSDEVKNKLLATVDEEEENATIFS